MKRSLQILGAPSDREAAERVYVTIEGRVVCVADAHDGSDALRFASLLGGTTKTIERERVDLHIVVRSTPQSPEARLRAEVMEQAADVVLGSPRPAFAKLLALRLAVG